MTLGLLSFWLAATLGLAFVVATVAALTIYSTRRERKARNPLRGLLELDERAARARTSVIAG